MKTILSLFFSLFVFAANAQFTAVTNTSGTVTYGSTAVTVTGSGTASSYTVWCGAGPYWIGAGAGSTPSPGSYTYRFSPAITAFRVEVTAANVGESIAISVNGSHYSLTAADIFAYAGTCGSGTMGLSGDTVLCTSAGGSGANVGINVYVCGGINSCTVETDGLLNGSVYSFFISDTAICSATNNGPLCLGDTLKLSVPGSSSDTFAWSGPGGFTSTDQNPIRTNVTFADSGLYRIIKNSTDTSYTDLVIKPAPVIATASNSPVCVGASLIFASFTDSVGETYSWSGPAGFTSTMQNPTIGSTALIDSGWYMLAAALNGCTDTAYVHVGVTPLPPVHLQNDTTVCTGNRVTLFSSDTYVSPAYLWNTGSTSPAINVTVAGSYWLQVTVNGCSASDTMVLSNKPYPLFNLGPDTAFCTGSNIALNSPSSPAEAYLWNTGATTGTIVVSSPGTYWCTIDSNGCNKSDTIVVVEKPNPAVNLGPDTSLCAGVPLTLQSSVAYSLPSYVWSTGSVAGTINPVTSGSYWLAVTVRGCTGRDTMNVVFRRHPDANLGPDGSFCFGGSYTINAVTGEDDYLWSTGATTSSITVTSGGTYWVSIDSVGCNSTDTINIIGVPSFGVHLGPDTTLCTLSSVNLQSADTYAVYATYSWNTGSTTPSITATTSGSYILTVNQLGCLERDTINVTIKFDTVIINNNDTSICAGKSVQVVTTTHEVGGSYTYQWVPTAGVPVSTVTSPLITPDTSAIYYILANTPGCPPIMDSFRIDVQPNPVVYIGGNRFICQFDTIHLDASVLPLWYSHYTYSWTPGTNLDDSTTKTVVFSGSTNTKLYVTVTTPQGCLGLDSAFIVVTPGNFGTITPGTQLCPHDTFVLTATGGVSYHWYPWLYTDDSLAASVTVSPVATTNYSVVVTESHGCKDTVSTMLTVFPAAVISLDDSIRLYPGETAQLSPLTNCNSFNWFPAAGLNSTVVSNPIANPDVNTRYFVKGTTSDGCSTVDSVDVILADESLLAVPNAFTPGNGVNGSFRIIMRGEATLNYFRVFNRWGNVVYETKNIAEGWDGTFSGTPQPVGVYVYDIQAATSTGKLVKMHGNVTLLR